MFSFDPIKDQLKEDKEFTGSIWEKIGYSKYICPNCKAHLKSTETGLICLNTCHLPKVMQHDFAVEMKKIKDAMDLRKNIPVSVFGKDHWSTFAYAHHCAINFEGLLDPIRMRVDGDTYPTRLKDGVKIKGHSDYNCLEDLESTGFLNMTTGLGQHITITDKGFEAMSQLSKHKATGGIFATFVFLEKTELHVEET